MDADRLSRWLTVLANIGVIAGIIVLVVEIQQSNRIALAATEIEVRNSYDEINKSIYTDPNLAQMLMKLSLADPELTAEEDYRVFVLVLSTINTWIAIEVAYANGLVPVETYNAIEDDLRSWLHDLPGIHPYFQRAYDSFPAQHDFDVYRTIDRVLKE